MQKRQLALSDIALKNLPAPVKGEAQYPDGKIRGTGVSAGGVGRYPYVTLAQARPKAHEALTMIAQGKDPRTPNGEEIFPRGWP
jgi:hypothetical protein